MEIINCEQGTSEWLEARLGIATSSSFDKIISSTGKSSTQSDAYLNKLLGDYLAGSPEESYKNEHMEHGNETEDEARVFFEFETGLDVEQVGFCKIDGAGCSPDGLIGTDSGLEIKCPTRPVHVGYLRSNKIPYKYIPQVQGSMYVTGRNSWYFMSYHQDLQPLIVKVQRDQDWINLLITQLAKFNTKLDEVKNQLEAS